MAFFFEMQICSRYSPTSTPSLGESPKCQALQDMAYFTSLVTSTSWSLCSRYIVLLLVPQTYHARSFTPQGLSHMPAPLPRSPSHHSSFTPGKSLSFCKSPFKCHLFCNPTQDQFLQYTPQEHLGFFLYGTHHNYNQ